MLFIEIPIHPDPKYFLQDLSLRSNVRFSLETRLDDPRISRPFYRGGGDLNNFEIFPQARRGNPLTCKTTLPLGLPRRLLLPRQRSDFFPASCPPTLQQTTPPRPSSYSTWTKERNRPNNQCRLHAFTVKNLRARLHHPRENDVLER